MRYSIVHTESSLGWGGQEIRILTEARAFRAKGYEVHIIAPPESNLAINAVDFDVPVIRAPIFKRNLKAFWRLRQALVRLHPSIVNTHSSTDSWLVAIVVLSLRSKPKVIRTRHICAQPSRSFATKWLYRYASQSVVTTGLAIRDQILALGVPADQVVSIPTGIDSEKYTPGCAIAAKSSLGLSGLTVIGLVATIRSWKGHRILIDALKGLSPDRYRLVFVGDGPIRASLQNELGNAGLEKLVLFAGHQNDVLPWLRAMDIFVLPSYANEGVSQALIQAMMAGIPVVATSAGAIAEVAKHRETALVVEPNNAGQLHDAIMEMLLDRDLAHYLARNARDFVLKNHGEDRMISAMGQLFESVSSA